MKSLVESEQKSISDAKLYSSSIHWSPAAAVRSALFNTHVLPCHHCRHQHHHQHPYSIPIPIDKDGNAGGMLRDAAGIRKRMLL